VTATLQLEIERNVPIQTWYRVGGSARRLARPRSIDDVRRCIEIDSNLRVLGDGANLLVADEGVQELVLAFTDRAMQAVRFEDGPSGPGSRMIAMAGANLPKLITDTVRRGLEGLEGLGGIPASIGGAAVMNAGGTFGQIADVIACIHTIDRQGRERTLQRSQIDYSYRHSGLSGVVITCVELDLRPGDPAALRGRLKDVMAYKKNSQPMGANSAGCCFRNPSIRRDIALAAGWTKDSSGDASDLIRVSAGMLIDRAGCKGLRIGSAEVSQGHANFLVADTGGRAGDVIALMAECSRRVFDAFGVRIEPEVVVWGPGRA